MARLPGWIAEIGDGTMHYDPLTGEGSYALTVRVRRWHPGYWWYVVRMALRLRVG